MPQCAVCQSTKKLIGEHLFADWIGRLLTTSASNYAFGTDVAIRFSKVRDLH